MFSLCASLNCRLVLICSLFTHTYTHEENTYIHICVCVLHKLITKCALGSVTACVINRRKEQQKLDGEKCRVYSSFIYLLSAEYEKAVKQTLQLRIHLLLYHQSYRYERQVYFLCQFCKCKMKKKR